MHSSRGWLYWAGCSNPMFGCHWALYFSSSWGMTLTQKRLNHICTLPWKWDCDIIPPSTDVRTVCLQLQDAPIQHSQHNGHDAALLRQQQESKLRSTRKAISGTRSTAALLYCLKEHSVFLRECHVAFTKIPYVVYLKGYVRIDQM